jgi:CRP-like cAMP-binding protein
MSMKLPNIFEREVTPLSVAAGQAIYSEGETRNAIYVVRSGEVELKVRGKSLEVAGPDGFFGEMALIDQGRRAATAVAKTRQVNEWAHRTPDLLSGSTPAADAFLLASCSGQLPGIACNFSF